MKQMWRTAWVFCAAAGCAGGSGGGGGGGGVGDPCSADGDCGGDLTCVDGSCAAEGEGESEGDAMCGDGAAEGAEECDGANLGGGTCESEGFAGGTLACSGTCTYDTSGCTSCGDGVADPGDACDGADLGGADCASLGHAGGALACSADCTFDESACEDCGNGDVDPGEECDGTDLGGADCEDEGFWGGDLACEADCTLDTGGCFDEPNIGDECACTDEDADEFACVESDDPPTCTSGAVCLRLSDDLGVCSLSGCEVDDPDTDPSEDTCADDFGSDFVCVGFAAGDDDDDENDETFDNFCVERCDPGDGPCSAGVACDPYWGALVLPFDDFPDSLCLSPRCETGDDCGVDMGQECDPAAADPGCPVGTACAFDTVTGEGPTYACDDTVAGGWCMLPGDCDVDTGLCVGHDQGSAGAEMGDPCFASTDCPDDAFCLREILDDACDEVDFLRNGYCSSWLCAYSDEMDGLYACPGGSGCNRLFAFGFCQRSCDATDASSCRGNDFDPCTNPDGDFAGDYECYDWTDAIAAAGYACVLDDCSDGPVCDWTSRVVTCDLITDPTFLGGVDCDIFGSDAVCRDFSTAAETDPDSPDGWCGDDTFSGPAFDTAGDICDPCGNLFVDVGEDCDGPDLGGATCLTLGHDGGTLTCSVSCTFVEAFCTDCGDGVQEGAEDCDGGDLGGETCVTQGFPGGGTLACNGADCTFDTSGCTP